MSFKQRIRQIKRHLAELEATHSHIRLPIIHLTRCTDGRLIAQGGIELSDDAYLDMWHRYTIIEAIEPSEADPTS